MSLDPDTFAFLDRRLVKATDAGVVSSVTYPDPMAPANPAVAADGTIYTVGRAHSNTRYDYVVGGDPDLTLKWAACSGRALNSLAPAEP